MNRRKFLTIAAAPAIIALPSLMLPRNPFGHIVTPSEPSLTVHVVGGLPVSGNLLVSVDSPGPNMNLLMLSQMDYLDERVVPHLPVNFGERVPFEVPLSMLKSLPPDWPRSVLDHRLREPLS